MHFRMHLAIIFSLMTWTQKTHLLMFADVKAAPVCMMIGIAYTKFCMTVKTEVIEMELNFNITNFVYVPWK